MRSNKNPILFILLLTLLVILFLFDLTVGAQNTAITDIVKVLLGHQVDSTTSNILLHFRLPKAIVAICVGVALSTGGLQMQTLFRNPLADPYILGVSSGAGLGVALFLMGLSSFTLLEPMRNLGIYAAAWLGSGIVLVLILLVSTRMRDVMSVLILGIMFGSAISAIINILQYFSSQAMLKTYVVWTMGSLGAVSMDKLPMMVIGILLGVLLSLYSIKPLNALLLGESYARSMGVNVRRTRTIIFLATSILTGTITAFCGPIGFVGIAVPHIARMLFREANHRILMPAVMLLGAIIMLFCDILSQLTKVVLPINSITALLGIPIIIYVVIRHNKGTR